MFAHHAKSRACKKVPTFLSLEFQPVLERKILCKGARLLANDLVFIQTRERSLVNDQNFCRAVSGSNANLP
jgi:hypothetical protein